MSHPWNNREKNHPITAQIATLNTMAVIQGIGDENRISWPGEVVVTANFDGAPSACGISSDEKSEFSTCFSTPSCDSPKEVLSSRVCSRPSR